MKDKYDARLLQCKGARTVRVSEVPLSNKSLNSGDVFILDLGLSIYVFNAPGANRMERAKGTEVANQINSDERSGRAKVRVYHTNISTKVNTFQHYYNYIHVYMCTYIGVLHG